jgi:Arc/MetJ family transcription regulator
MRTNIDIDDELMRQAMEATGTTTKKAAVEAAMRKAIQLKLQEGILKLRGKVVWRGHDDDWFASDEEILAKRRLAEKDAASERAHLPAAEPMAISAEAR